MTVALITEADANRMETVADVMVRHPKLCHEDSTVGEVRQLFADDHVHAVLIMSGTRLLTVIDRADLGPETADSAPAARLGRLSGRVTAPTAMADTALQQMIAAGRRRLAVAGPDGTLLGLLCLKRSGTGFCADENVRRRQREHLQQQITGLLICWHGGAGCRVPLLGHSRMPLALCRTQRAAPGRAGPTFGKADP